MRKRLRLSQRALRILALGAVVAVAALALLFQDMLLEAEAAAYPGIFLISLVSSATVFIPIPGIVVVCTAATTLNPVLLGVVSGAGATLGETTGYLAGYSGRGILKNDARYRRIQTWVQRRGWIVLFLFALVPNPLFDLAGLAAGVARIPLWQFYAAVGAGKVIRSIGLAYLCAAGHDLFRIFL